MTLPLQRLRAQQNLTSQLPREHYPLPGADFPRGSQCCRTGRRTDRVRSPGTYLAGRLASDLDSSSPVSPDAQGAAGSAMPSGSAVKGICILFFSFLSLTCSSSSSPLHGRFPESQTGVNIDGRGPTAQQGMRFQRSS